MSIIHHVKRLKEFGMDPYQADEIAEAIEDTLTNHVSKVDLALAVSKLETVISNKSLETTRWIIGSVCFAILLQCVSIFLAIKK